jgi:hypothetical protein
MISSVGSLERMASNHRKNNFYTKEFFDVWWKETPERIKPIIQQAKALMIRKLEMASHRLRIGRLRLSNTLLYVARRC